MMLMAMRSKPLGYGKTRKRDGIARAKKIVPTGVERNITAAPLRKRGK